MMAIPKSSMSPLEHQQFQRLKVNRIAVIQELKVDHILNYLLSKSVLNGSDLKEIEKGRTTTEKSKRLLDILPTKGRASNWYKHFRAALLNPSVDDTSVKHKYQILVEFLDNTIIDQMSHPVRLKHQISKNDEQISTFPKYKPLPEISNNMSRPPSITGRGRRVLSGSKAKERLTSAGDGENTKHPAASTISPEDADSAQKWTIRQLQGTGIPHTVQYWDKDPENFTSLLEIPLNEIIQLERSSHAADALLGEQQRDAADRMRQLEIAYFLWKNQKNTDEMILCTCSAVLDIIQDVGSHHLYFKYFENMRKEYDIELALEIVYSYDEITQWLASASDQPTCSELVNIGFNLISFLSEFGHFEPAWQVVSSIESFLNRRRSMWMISFHFYVRCLELSNRCCDLEKAEKYHTLASSFRDQIGKAMSSFGQETLDCSELFRQTSIMLMENGSFGSSYTWAQKAMQEVDLENKSIVVNVLCTASVAYANQWKVIRAEDLAVETVQQAKLLLGVYNPIYLYTLQNYIRFSNQFRQDSFTVEASIAALKIATHLYGYNSTQVAHAYAGHANSLLAAKQFGNVVFFDSAEKAYNIAVERYPLNHPLLFPFIRTLVSSLIQRAQLSTNDKERHELLLWAEGEAKQLSANAETQFGETSYKTAMAHLLLAEVYTEARRMKDAEAYYNMVANTVGLCMGVKHGNVMKIKAKLAVLTKQTGEILKAKAVLKDIIESFDTAAYYMSWYNEAYEALISCYEQTESDELVKECKSKHMGWKWISEDNSRKITWRELHSRPEGYDSFLEKFELWRLKVKKVRVHIEQLKQTKDELTQKDSAES